MSEYWCAEASARLPEGKQLYLGGGFDDGVVAKCIERNGADFCGDLFSTQEEADARILLHAAHASHMTPRIVICSPDTDVAILATYFSPKLGEISEMYFYTGVGDKRRFIDIHGLACALGETLCELLLPFHVFAGCDSTSCIGKPLANS